MSSPNEPGQPRAGDGTGNGHDAGSAGRPSPLTSAAPGRTANQAPRPQHEAPGHGGAHQENPRGGHAAGGPSSGQGMDARLNRFISGTSGSAGSHGHGDSGQGAATRNERPEGARSEGRPEAYASELPDLSGTPPRTSPPQQRKAPAERPAEPANRTAAATTSRLQVGNRARGPVRASMQIRRVDPWSTLKVSLVLSVALFFVWMIAVAFLYLVLGGMGVWTKLNSNVGDLLTSASGGGGQLVSSGTIFGGAALIGLVNIVLLTAMATAGAFIYNLTTDLVGGVEVTLADRD